MADQRGHAVAQALVAAGDVLRALNRRVLLDVCGSWPRLLKAAGVTSRGARCEPRWNWEWVELKEAVEIALCYADQPDSLKWQEADGLLRGFALASAELIESRLDRQDVSAESLRLAGNSDAYRAFGEGRA